MNLVLSDKVFLNYSRRISNAKCRFCNKNRRVTFGGHCCSRGWLEQELVDDLLRQTRLRVSLLHKNLRCSDSRNENKLLEAIRKEKAIVVELLNMREGIHLGAAFEVTMDSQSIEPSFITATTGLKSYVTAEPLK